jgi:alpha-mannosidase
VGEFSPQAAIQLGYGFNHPVVPVGTTVHEGELPPEAGAVEILTPNVMLSGLKKAEDSDALIIRLYEFGGEQTEARVRLSHWMLTSGAAAVEVDLMEQELAQNSARIEDDELVVTIPAFGIGTVRVG